MFEIVNLSQDQNLGEFHGALAIKDTDNGSIFVIRNIFDEKTAEKMGIKIVPTGFSIKRKEQKNEDSN